ncbi:MAG: hypothetical protein AB7P23_00565 [Amphiplicatus sp.]
MFTRDRKASDLNILWTDLIGFIGVAFIVTTYFLSQLGKMQTTRPLYPALNGIGSLLILFSLCFTFNAASLVIELFWLAISSIGLVRSLTMRRAP